MRYVKGLLLFLIIFVLVIFCVQNVETLRTSLNFTLDMWKLGVWESPSIPIYVVLMGGFLIGGLFMFVYFVIGTVRCKGSATRMTKENARQQREIENLQRELDDLRAAHEPAVPSYPGPAAQTSSTASTLDDDAEKPKDDKA